MYRVHWPFSVWDFVSGFATERALLATLVLCGEIFLGESIQTYALPELYAGDGVGEESFNSSEPFW